MPLLQPSNPIAWNERFETFFGRPLDPSFLLLSSKPLAHRKLPLSLWTLTAWSERLQPFCQRKRDFFKVLSYFYHCYPPEEDFKHLDFLLHLEGLPAVLKRLYQNILVQTELRRRNPKKWLTFPPQTLFVEVTLTSYYPYTSGVQRVIGELAQFLKTNATSLPHFFIQIASQDHQPSPLNEEALQHLLSFSGLTKSPKNHWTFATNWAIFLTFFGFIRILMIESFKKIFLPSSSRLFEKAYKASQEALLQTKHSWIGSSSLLSSIDRIKSKIELAFSPLTSVKQKIQSYFTLAETPRLFLWDQTILIPQLIEDPRAIETFLTLRKYVIKHMNLIIHDLIPLLHPEFTSNQKEFIFFLRLLQVADRITCMTESIKEEVKHLMHLVPRKILDPYSVHSSWPGTPTFPAISKAQKPSPRLSFLETIPFILSVSTFEPRKNQLFILRAFLLDLKKNHSSHTHTHLVFTGNPGLGNELFFEEIKQIARAQIYVHFLPQVSDTELAWLYHHCLFTIFCSAYEGFGMPVLESLAFKKPALTSNRGSLYEVAKEGGGCLCVDPEDLNEISEKLGLLSRNPKLREELSQQIRLPPERTWASFIQTILG